MLFNVYPRFDISLTHGKGSFVFDNKGRKYLDLYGGHGVISIGHSHPHYVNKLQQQLGEIGFYSNSIQMPLQEELATRLATVSGYLNHRLFLCNSGSEANENALKLASFHTGKTKVIAFKNSFHGRTAASLKVTDNSKLSAPINRLGFEVAFTELNQQAQVEQLLQANDIAAVIIEGIQGVGGLDFPTNEFLQFLSYSCKQHGALLIIDEIQSGFGRSGNFFAHQEANIQADLITMAKGMGNGFPVGGVLIHPDIQASFGMLGSTFGGNQLACTAALSVLDTLEHEQILQHVTHISSYLKTALNDLPIPLIKGKGLMLGLEFDDPIQELRKTLLEDFSIFTGASTNPNLLRILPPLTVKQEDLSIFIHALKDIL